MRSGQQRSQIHVSMQTAMNLYNPREQWNSCPDMKLYISWSRFFKSQGKLFISNMFFDSPQSVTDYKTKLHSNTAAIFLQRTRSCTQCPYLKDTAVWDVTQQTVSTVSPALMLGSCSAYSWTQNMKATFLQNVGWLSTYCKLLHSRWHTLHNHLCENFKLYSVNTELLK
jgi:hypothetical protein